MLPEQALRDAPDVLCVAHWRFEHLGWFVRLRKRFQVGEKPHTLTGDEWRAAWAETHDPQADAALDAIY